MVTLEEAEVAKTLAEGIVGLRSSEREKPEFVKRGSSDGAAGSAFERSAVRGLSADGGDIMIMGGSSSAPLALKEDEKNGGLGLELGLGLGLGLGYGGGAEAVKGMDSVLGVDKNEKNVVDKLAAMNTSMVSFGDDSNRKVAPDGNSISLVEFHGPLERGNKNEEIYSSGDDKASLTQNGAVPNGKSIKRPSSTSKVGENEMNGRGEEIDEDSEDVNKDNGDNDEDDEEDEGEDVAGQERHNYSVGDFVWGKIRSHPWWPGLIYDSSDASESAGKYSQKGRYLVAYFGDGTFSWCLPSQLKPFSENFEEMSKHSNSKNFVNAVHKAIDEVGRRVELGMTCPCIPEGKRIRLTRPLAVNAGIKAGTLVAEGSTDKHLIPRYEPIEVLARVRYLAQVVSISSMLELRVLKSWLSAFYSTKGNRSLCIYHEPRYVEGLQDKNRNGKMDTNDFSVPVQVPIQGPFEEDWLCSPGSHEKCPPISEDKLSRKRKQKSVAELMKDDVNQGSMAKKGTLSGRSISVKKTNEGNDDTGNQKASIYTYSGTDRQRKREDATKNKTSNVKIFSGGEAAAASESPLSQEQERSEASGGEDGNGKAKDELENVSPRERKKSKYLSPPYTSLKHTVRNSSSKRDLETEPEKITSATQLGEQMVEVVGQPIGSPPISRCSSNALKENPSKQLSDRHDKYGSGSHAIQTAEQDDGIANHMQVNASLNEVLSEILSTAVSPLYSREERLLDMIKGFSCTFRSALYVNGPNYSLYHKHLAGRKRKSSTPKSEKLRIDLNQPDEGPELISQLTGIEKKKKAKGDTSKLKQAAKAFLVKENMKESEQNTSPTNLIVTFSPGFSLPSKADLIHIFSKFGALNDKETKVLYNSYCAHVVFQRTSDAEAAFEISMKNNPFGAVNVNYRLQRSSPSQAPSSNQKGFSALKKTSENAVSPEQSDSGVSQVRFIRQKLQGMISRLENCDDVISPDVRSTLESEMKILLDKVSSMA